MRRRPPPAPARVWLRKDMPSRLQHFDPLDWGCLTVAQWEPDWQTAHSAWQRGRRQWLDEHHVDVLAELRAEMAERRARQRLLSREVSETSTTDRRTER